MSKTASSFVCLAILMILSFIVSTYEYYNVHTQYEKAIKVAEDSIKGQNSVDWYSNMKNVVNNISYKNINSWSN